jgi:hypothetical protein
MTLESAERLVEKILRQLEVQYEVTGDAPSHHDHDDDGLPGGEARTIVVDAGVLSRLPEELHPFVTTSAATAAPAPDADTPPAKK